MTKPRALILKGEGINCEGETQHAFELAGAETEQVHIRELVGSPERIHRYQILAFPGGFSYGDDIGSGKVLAVQFERAIGDEFLRFADEGKLVIGICNGFQTLVKMGALPASDRDYRNVSATLTFNDSGKFEDRWVYLMSQSGTPCVWTRDLETIELPVRHGEGKFVVKDGILPRLYQGKQIVFNYADSEGNQLASYPWNPNGSVDNIAAVCDPTGRILGMMPHPEAHVYPYQHPRWTRRRQQPEEGDGLRIFGNAVSYFV